MTSSFGPDHRVTELENEVKQLRAELFRLKMSAVPKGTGLKKKLHLPKLT